MSQDRTPEGNQAPFVLLGESDVISFHDRALLSQLLGHYGVSVEFMSREEFEDRMRLAHTTIVEPVDRPVSEEKLKEFSFIDISSPDQYLVREHFEDLDAITGNTGPKNRGRYTRIFSYFVGYGRNRWTSASPTEPPNLIIIKTREELGIGPYNGRRHFGKYDRPGKDYSGWAIEAGSIVNHAGTIRNVNLKITDKHILFLANQLKEQFKK